MRRSRAPPPPTGGDTSAGSDVDIGVLQWGSSVNLNEDLRRTILTEIGNIDDSITNLHGSVKNEERTASQLAKDLIHAKSEMINLRRGAAENLDDASMNADVQARLAETTKSQVIAVVTPPVSPEGPTDGEYGDGNVGHDEEGDINNPLPSSFPALGRNKSTLAAYVARSAAEARRVSDSIRSHRDALRDTRTRIASVDEECAGVSGRIDSDDLAGAKGAAERELDARRRELEAERQRERSVKEATKQARGRCGDYGQEIANSVSFRHLIHEALTNLSQGIMMSCHCENSPLSH